MSVLPDSSEERKKIPLCSGLLDYFPSALAEVARVSLVGNLKHNGNEPLHHARGKSMDHTDCIMRHLMQRGEFDEVECTDTKTGEKTVYRVRHTACLAWRALALLQMELEAAGAPMARGARTAQ